MKRFFWAMFIIAMSASFAMAAPTMRYFTTHHANSLITLNQSTVAVIELKSNPSTGHGWRVKSPLGRQIRVVGSDFEPSQPGRLGGGGTEKIYVVGTARGRCSLTLEYRRTSASTAIKSLRYHFDTRKAFTESFSLPSPVASEVGEDTQPQVSSMLGLPTAFNWCDQNGCTPVKDQGNCGSCWAFATAAPLESLIKMNDGVTVDLSEQYLVSCNSEGWGCDGGFWAHDYHEWKTVSNQSVAGAVLEANAPYRARDSSCGSNYAKSHQIASWEYVCGNSYCTPSTDEIKQAMYDHGPITVAVCANSAMQNYSGGIFTGPGCSEENHGVVLVGWNDDGGYWIMRNSWGSNWGESGYMRIRYGVSEIGTEAAYVSYGGAPDPEPGPEPDPQPGDAEMENGQTIGNLSANTGNWLHFYIDVPNGATNLTMSISGGTGDADLYARFDAAPGTSAYDCRPYRNGNSETCTQAQPAAGRWYMGLHAYNSFSGVSLTAEYDNPGTDPLPDPDLAGQCITADNQTHIAQGHAYNCGSYNWQACAVGSDNNLGWATGSYSQTSSIQETAADYWEKVDGCP